MVISCEAPDGARLRFELQPLTRIGRGEENDIQLFEEAASAQRCEIRLENDLAIVRDLGSSNGIFVNGEPVQEGVLRPGSVLKVGETEFLFEAAAAAEAEPGLAEEDCVNHPGREAGWRCSKCHRLFCSSCVVDGRKYGTPRVKFCPVCSSTMDDLTKERQARQEQEMAEHPLDPWKYPFRGEGLILLITGTAFLAITGIIQRFALFLGGLVFIFATGYLLAYSQKIITTTANAEHEPPAWPDFSDFWQDILPPFMQALALFLLCGLLPLGARLLLPEGSPAAAIVPAALLLAGLFLAPMAWLGMAMTDQIAAASPHVVIPAIARIPGPYLGLVLQLAALAGANAAVAWALDKVPVPFLPWLISTFLSIYFLMVISRLLGILYFRNRSRLGWP